MKAIDKGIIARWKIDTSFENWLGRKADHSHFFKNLYVSFYKIADKAYYKKGYETVKRTAQRIRKNFSEYSKKELILDMVYSLHRFGLTFDEYAFYKLFEFTADGKNEYVSEKMRYEYYLEVNSDEGMKTLKDKGKTFEKLGEYFKRDCIVVRSAEQKDDFENFAKKHKKFIIKPIGNTYGCGRGIQIVDSEQEDVGTLFDSYKQKGDFIAEELIKQSDTMRKLHPSSVNTLRVVTIQNADGVKIFYPFLRVGRGEAFIDNGAVGGLIAGVDSQSGIVYTTALTEHDDIKYLVHPDTGVVFPGFQIPNWQEAVSLVTEMACKMPDMHYIGWDIAHTDQGWVLVEGNGDGQLCGQQLVECRGLKNEFLQLLFKQ